MSNGFETGRRIIQKSSSPLLSSIQNGEGIILPVVKRGKGPYLYDYDKNRFVDFYLSRGSLIFGHAHPVITSIMKSWLTRGYTGGYPTVSHGMLAHRAQASILSYKKPRNSSSNWVFFNSKDDAIGMFLEILRVLGKKGVYVFGGTENLSSPLWCSDITTFQTADSDMDFLRPVDCLILHGSRQISPDAALDLLKKAKSLRKIVVSDETEFASFVNISALKDLSDIDIRIFGEWISGGLDFGAICIEKDTISNLSDVLGEITLKQPGMAFPPLYKVKAAVRFFKLLESAGGFSELKSRYGLFASILDPDFFETVNGMTYFLEKMGREEQYRALRFQMLRHGILLPAVQTDPLYISFAHSTELLRKSGRMINNLVQSFFI